MTAYVHDLLIEQGASFALDAKLGTLDLTGWTGRSQIRRTPRDSLVQAQFNVAVIDGPNATFRLSLTAGQTSALNFTTGVYDVELVSPDGLVLRVMEGKVRLSPEITR